MATIKDYRIKLEADTSEVVSGLDALAGKFKDFYAKINQSVKAQGQEERAERIATTKANLDELDKVVKQSEAAAQKIQKAQKAAVVKTSDPEVVKRLEIQRQAEENFFARQAALRRASVKESQTDGVAQIANTKARLQAEADLHAANVKRIEALRDAQIAKAQGDADKIFRIRTRAEVQITNAIVQEAKKRDQASEVAFTRLQKSARFGEDIATIAGGGIQNANFAGLGATIGDMVGGPIGGAIGTAIGGGVQLAMKGVTALLNEFDPSRVFAIATARAEELRVKGTEVGTAIQAIDGALAAGNLEAGFAAAKGQLEGIKAIDEDIGANLELILNMPGNKTAADLAQIQGMLAQIQGIAANEALLQQFEAADAAIGATKDSLVDLIGTADQSMGFFETQTTDTTEQAARVAEINTLLQTGNLTQEDRNELMTEQKALDAEIFRLGQAQTAVNNSIEGAITARLAAAEQAKGSALTEQEIAANMLLIQNDLVTARNQALIQDNTLIATDEQILSIVQQTRDAYVATNSEVAQNNAEIQAMIPAYEQGLGLLNSQLDTIIAQTATEEEKAAIERQGLEIKLTGLKQVEAALGAQESAIIAAIEAQKTSVDAENKRIEAAQILAQKQAEIQKIMAGQQKEASALTQVQAGDLTSALKAVQAERAKVQQAIGSLQKQVDGVGKAEKRAGAGRGAGGGARGAKDESTVKQATFNKAQEDAQKAAIKQQEDFIKEQAKLFSERLKTESEQLKSNIQNHIERVKANNAEIAYRREVNQKLQELRETISAQAGEIAKSALNEINRVLKAFQPVTLAGILQDIFNANLNVAKDFEAEQKKRIAERESQIAAQGDIVKQSAETIASLVSVAQPSIESLKTGIQNVLTGNQAAIEAAKKEWQSRSGNLLNLFDSVGQTLSEQLKTAPAEIKAQTAASTPEQQSQALAAGELIGKLGQLADGTMKATAENAKTLRDLGTKAGIEIGKIPGRSESTFASFINDLKTKAEAITTAATARENQAVQTSGQQGQLTKSQIKAQIDELSKLSQPIKDAVNAAKQGATEATTEINRLKEEIAAIAAAGPEEIARVTAIQQLTALAQGAEKYSENLLKLAQAQKKVDESGDFETTMEGIAEIEAATAEIGDTTFATFENKASELADFISDTFKDKVPADVTSAANNVNKIIGAIKIKAPLDILAGIDLEKLAQARQILQDSNDALSIAASAIETYNELQNESLSNVERQLLAQNMQVAVIDRQIAGLQAQVEAGKALSKEQQDQLTNLALARGILLSMPTAEAEGLDVKDRLDDIKQYSEQIAGLIDIAAQVPETIDSIASAVGQGDAAGAISAGADLAQSVGQALLASPSQSLKTIGAVLVGGALIAKAVAKIAALIQGTKVSEAELAERRLATEQALLDLETARLDIMREMAGMGEKSLDTAREQLEAIREEHELRLGNSAQARELSGLDTKTLGQMKKDAAARKAAAQARIDEGERVLEEDRADRERFAEQEGIDTKGSTKDEIQSAIDAWNAGLTDTLILEGNINAELEFRTSEMEKQLESLDNEIALIELKQRIEGESLEGLKAIAQVRRQALEAALDLAGIDFAGLDDEELKNLLATSDELPDNVIQLANTWLDATDAVNEYNEKVKEAGEEEDKILTSLIRKHQQRIQAIRDAAKAQGGEMTPAQRAELESIRAQMVARLQETGATPEEIADFVASLPEFEKGGIVPGNAGQAVNVTAHAGELIVPAEITRLLLTALNRPFQSIDNPDALSTPLESVGNPTALIRPLESVGNPTALNLLASPQARIVGESIRRREAAVYNITNNVNVNVNQRNDFAAMHPERAIGSLKTAFEEDLIRRVNRGLESGKIDTRRI